MKERFDALVIGGGPAGSSAARRLALRGRSVMLLEKKPMPRRKLCGGAVSAQARSYLDVPLPESLIDWHCYGARVHYGRRVLEGRSKNRIADLVTRSRFDEYLVHQARDAGAQVRFEPVDDLAVKTDGVVAHTAHGSIHGRTAIVATGANSRFVKLVRERDDKEGFAVAMEVEIPVDRERDRFADLDGLIDIHFGVARFGYGWIFHHGDHYSVGIGGLRSKLPRPNDAMREFMDSVGFKGDYAGLKGHPIPRGGLKRKVVADRILLAGDAAGYVDPFYGEGIAYAIRSGQLAAETVAECAAEGSSFHAQALGRYTRKCSAEFDTNLRYSLLMSKLMYRYPGLFLKLLVLDRRFLEKYLEVPQHRLSYRGFLGWMAPRIPWYLVNTLRSV